MAESSASYNNGSIRQGSSDRSGDDAATDDDVVLDLPVEQLLGDLTLVNGENEDQASGKEVETASNSEANAKGGEESSDDGSVTLPGGLAVFSLSTDGVCEFLEFFGNALAEDQRLDINCRRFSGAWLATLSKIQVFVVTEEIHQKRSRNLGRRGGRLVVGQIGFQCSECCKEVGWSNDKGAIAFPSMISNVHKAVLNMRTRHLMACQSMSPTDRQLVALSSTSPSGFNNIWVRELTNGGLENSSEMSYIRLKPMATELADDDRDPEEVEVEHLDVPTESRDDNGDDNDKHRLIGDLFVRTSDDNLVDLGDLGDLGGLLAGTDFPDDDMPAQLETAANMLSIANTLDRTIAEENEIEFIIVSVVVTFISFTIIFNIAIIVVITTPFVVNFPILIIIISHDNTIGIKVVS